VCDCSISVLYFQSNKNRVSILLSVRNQSPNDVPSHPRTPKSHAKLLWVPPNCHIVNSWCAYTLLRTGSSVRLLWTCFHKNRVFLREMRNWPNSAVTIHSNSLPVRIEPRKVLGESLCTARYSYALYFIWRRFPNSILIHDKVAWRTAEDYELRSTWKKVARPVSVNNKALAWRE
jgi:hypothetical protein